MNVPRNSKDFVQESIRRNQVSELRHHIDLNLTFNEEEDPSSTPSIPEAVVKIATMEIDLEAPAALEPETDDTHVDIIKATTEAIISISSFEER
ncbi:tetratricopeptide-like helical domain-containing protein [Tanacetum coccineum]